MTIFASVVLGIVQGLTEFLPISSSGHLVFVPRFLGWPDQGIAFDAIVHLGTLVALFIYFRATVGRLFRSLRSRDIQQATDRKFFWRIIIATIPAAAIGAVFGDSIEVMFRTPLAIAVSSIGWGTVLYLGQLYERIRTREGTVRKKEHTSVRAVLGIGFMQAIAFIPGTSRSGITITGGLFAGLEKSEAVSFSFLMGIPIIALAGASQLMTILYGATLSVGMPELIIGFIASLLSGIAAIHLLFLIAKRWSFTPFVIYRIVLGIIIFAVLV